MSEIKDRLLKFLEHKGIGQTNFEKITKLSNGLINNIKDNISSKSLIKIIKVYPEINLVWLLTGDGEMTETDIQKVADVGKEISKLIETVIDLQAYANVFLITISELSSKQKGMEAALVSGQLLQAIRDENTRLHNELLKKQKFLQAS